MTGETLDDLRRSEPRLLPARPDLAALWLKATVRAEAYSAGAPRRVVAPRTRLARAPRFDAPTETEALAGDLVTVFEETIEGWAWGQLERDGYVGYLAADDLGPAGPAPTHRVAVPKTFLYPAADMKLPPAGALPMGAGVCVAGDAETRGLAYAVLATGEAVVARHLEPATAVATDYVTVAEHLLGVPYLWGGTSGFGIDCSGLVQLALRFAGRIVARDTDLQERTVGHRLAGDAAWQRGDLLFWPGHVGILADGETLLHASGHHMQVVREPVRPAIARIAARGTALRQVRRP